MVVKGGCHHHSTSCIAIHLLHHRATTKIPQPHLGLIQIGWWKKTFYVKGRLEQKNCIDIVVVGRAYHMLLFGWKDRIHPLNKTLDEKREEYTLPLQKVYESHTSFKEQSPLKVLT